MVIVHNIFHGTVRSRPVLFLKNTGFLFLKIPEKIRESGKGFPYPEYPGGNGKNGWGNFPLYSFSLSLCC